MVKPAPALTADQRMELYERPFKILFVDTMGPISPPDGEYRDIAHAECPFSRFCWIHPMKEATGDEWARFLVEDVFLDVAGFPVVLRSDRGTEFVNEIVEAVNKLFGVEHAFGAAFHPESQGYIEGRHKSINYTLGAYCKNNPARWARRLK